MREKAGSEHSFVKIKTVGENSVIELTGATHGKYTLELESYDSIEPGEPIIRTEKIALTISSAKSNCPITA